jgi:diguanylate cyclase (GGDEF)-like protein
MDPRTAVVLMTLNLVVTGALIASIARRTADERPLLYCGASTGLFALAFTLRLALGLDSAHPLVLLADATMVLAASLFIHGQRRYLLRQAAPVRPWLLLAAAFGIVQALVTLLLGQQARHIGLNTALATCYLTMAANAGLGLRLLPAAEHAAQRLMFGTATVLGGATALRALDAAVRGVDTLFVGPTAQAYYALSSICILLMGPSVLWWLFVRLNHQLQQLAIHDALTGALNRNGLVQAVRRHFAAREVRPLVWMLADIDHFKQVNDRHGHAAGDRLLQAVARALMGQVRGADFVARLGGEEFVVAASGLTAAQALALAERLRSEVGALELTLPAGGPLRCTVSVGVSPPFDSAAAWEAALQSADAALYSAKAAGRNRVQAGAALPAPA